MGRCYKWLSVVVWSVGLGGLLGLPLIDHTFELTEVAYAPGKSKSTFNLHSSSLDGDYSECLQEKDFDWFLCATQREFNASSVVSVATLENAEFQVPNIMLVARPPLSDPREALFLDFPLPMHQSDSAERRWFLFLLQYVENLVSQRWLAKTLYVNFVSTNYVDGSPVPFAAGSRQFLKWYYEDSGKVISDFPIYRRGLCRASFSVLPPSNKTSRGSSVFFQYVGPDLVATNGDHLYPSFSAAQHVGLTPKYPALYDVIYSQLIGAPLNHHHTPYLEKQISSFSMRLSGDGTEKLSALGRLMEVMVRELNNVVLQFHHSFNQFYISSPDSPKGPKWGDKRRVLPNQWLLCLLFISIAPMISDLPELINLFEEKKQGYLKWSYSHGYRNFIVKLIFGLSLLLMQLLFSWGFTLGALNWSLYRNYSLESSTQLCSGESLKFISQMARSTLFRSALSSFVVACGTFILQSRNLDSLIRTHNLAVRVAIPTMVFLLAIVSPPLAFVLCPLLSGVALINLVATESSWSESMISVAVAAIAVATANRLHLFDAFLQSRVWQSLVNAPAAFAHDVTTSSLKAHLCLGYPSFPVLILAYSLLFIAAAGFCISAVRWKPRKEKKD